MPEEKSLTSRKYTARQLKEQEMYTNVLKQLEKAIALKEDGLQIESDAVIDMLSDELHNIVSKYDDSAENKGTWILIRVFYHKKAQSLLKMKKSS